MANHQFQNFVQELHMSQYSDSQDFSEKAIPWFCEALDIDKTHLHYEVMLSDSDIADAVIAHSRFSKPWMVIETNTLGDDSMAGSAQVAPLWESSNAEIGVGLRPNAIVALHPGGQETYTLTSMSAKEAAELLGILTPPDSFFEDTAENFFDANLSGIESDKYSYKNFEINIRELVDALREVENAESSKEKGDTFEELAAVLLDGIDFFRVRGSNLNYDTGEVDLVIEYVGSEKDTIFDDWGRFILVECKNWSDTVGVSQVRDFYGKMSKSKVDFGVIITKNGISGDSGSNAIRWIRDYFQREGKMILNINSDEFELILEGESSLYSIMDEKMYRKRFPSYD